MSESDGFQQIMYIAFLRSGTSQSISYNKDRFFEYILLLAGTGKQKLYIMAFS